MYVIHLGGSLILVDTMREEDEPRPIYLNRYLNENLNGWTALTMEEKDYIRHHVTNFDFPETAAVYKVGRWRGREGFLRNRYSSTLLADAYA